MAFEFPEAQKERILSYLEGREGEAFPLHELVVRFEDKSEVSAFVPIYNGKNVIEARVRAEVAKMVLAASGTSGTCLSYVNNIANNLSALGIDDPEVTELWKAVNGYA